MFHEIFGRGCGCPSKRKQLKSCDVMWIILLLFILFNGGIFGLDICTLVILAVVFGSQFLCKEKKEERCGH
ncbi:MAG: hypothetical protein FWE45_02135 [Firmicutes bacterium]|nr:hypothetical protein [Bacillota bacterium]